MFFKKAEGREWNFRYTARFLKVDKFDRGVKVHGTQLSGEVEENNRNIYCSVYARVNRYGSTGTVEKREKGDCN